MAPKLHLLIDGQLIAGAGELPVINLANGAAFAMAPRADAAQLDTAVVAA